jgi:fructose-1,6-bisphosphatase
MPILILAMTESVCILEEEEEEDDNRREEEQEEAKVPTSIIVPIESVTRNKKRQRSYSGNSNSSSDSQTAIDFLTPQLLFRYQISRKEVVIWAINKMEADGVFQELPKDIQKTSSGI